MSSKIPLFGHIVLLCLLASSSFVLSQTTKFTNNSNTGDGSWATATNWTNGIPNAAGAKAQIAKIVDLPGPYTVGQLNFVNAQGGGINGNQLNSANGNGVLTITGNGVNQPLQMNKFQQAATFNIPVIFDSNGAAQNTFRQNQGQQNMVFAKAFTNRDPLIFTALNNSSQINFNHSLVGAGKIKFGTSTRPKFGANYNGAQYNGTMEIGGGAGASAVALVSNVADGGTFLRAGGVIDITNAGATITINGANTFKGNISVNNNTVGLVINKNQSAVGLISMGSGSINLSADAGVTSIAFADQSGQNWGTGTIVITGVSDNEVSFGTDQNGLTAGQLSKITLNGQPAEINNNGQLYVAGGGGGGGGGGNVVSTFNNAGGNSLWSNNANWTNGIPNHEEAKATIEAASLIIDGTYHLSQLKFSGNTPNAVSITQTAGSNLTIVGKGVNQAFQMNKGSLNVTIDADIIMNSAANTGAGGSKIWKLNSTNQVLTFAAGKTFTLSTDIVFQAQALSDRINFNGTIAGNKQLKLGTKVAANFGATYSGASHTGIIDINGGTSPNNVAVVSNVPDNGTFLNTGRQLNLTNQGSSITINGANTLKGNINTGNNTTSLVINKNQSAIGLISMGTGGINLSADAGVTTIAFADNSGQNWGTGTLAITGVSNNEVSFGTDANGLTADQLSKITLNGSTDVSINGNGQLSATGGGGGAPSGGNKLPTGVVDYVTIVKNKYSNPIEVLKNDFDDDGDPISLVSASSAQSIGIIDVNKNKGTIVYIPAPEFTGGETIIYTISDGTDESKGVLYVTVEENSIPIANEMSESAIEDTSKDIDLSASDANDDSLFYLLVDNPSNGEVSVSGDGKATYTPSSGFFGTDSFTFKVNDGMDDSLPASVTILVSSNDTDNDGILNASDLCPDTADGVAVDLTGCPIFELPENNNSVQVTSASCVGSNDGALKFSVADSSFDYSVRLIGLRSQNQGISTHEILGASNSISVTGLSEGLYSACFSVNGHPGYEQCFEVLIEQPKPLSAFIGINESSLTTNIELEGANSYHIEVNGTEHDVRGNNFTAALRTGINNIKVSTDKNCQGLVEKQVFLSEEIQYYPNPTIKDVNVHVSGKDKRVLVSVYSIKGELIYSREQEIKDFSRLTEIDLASQITGTYVVVMESETVRKVFKIVKE